MIYNENCEYHINLKKGDVGRYVILPGDPGRCEKIAALFDFPHLIAQNREYTTYTGTLCGEKVSVCSTGIGGPSAAIALEELCHIGADTFIRVGTAGGMEEKVRPGDIVIATGATRSEGTSCEYAPIEFPAVSDFTVTNALCAAARTVHANYHVGVVHSKDSFYGQHAPFSMPLGARLNEKWNAFIACGVLASEMECAALFTVGAVRRVRVGAVLSIMGNQARRDKGESETINHDTSLAVKTAVEAIKILIKGENI